MAMLETDQLVRLLHDRRHMLDCLAEGNVDKRTLVEHCDVSRSTVDRALSELDDRGIVDRVDGVYSLTPYGKLVFNVYEDAHETLHSIATAHPLVERAVEWARIDPVLFDGADVRVQRALGPALIDELLRPVSVIRIAYPPLWLLYGTLTHQNQDEFLQDKDLELILDKEVLEHIRIYYRHEFETLQQRNDVSVYKNEERLPFCLGVLEDADHVVATVLFEQDNEKVGVLSNDSPGAVDWATSVYRTHRDDAAPAVDLDGDGTQPQFSPQ